MGSEMCIRDSSRSSRSANRYGRWQPDSTFLNSKKLQKAGCCALNVIVCLRACICTSPQQHIEYAHHKQHFQAARMLYKSFLTAALPLVTGATTTPPQTGAVNVRTDFNFHVRDVKATRDAAPLEITNNVVSLKRTGLQVKGSAGEQDACRRILETPKLC